MAITPTTARFLLDSEGTKSKSPPVIGAKPKSMHGAQRPRSRSPARCRAITSTEAQFLRQRSRSEPPTLTPRPLAGCPFPPPRRTLTSPPQAASSAPHDVDGNTDWWIAHSYRLPEARRNGWVVSMALEEYSKEETFAKACGKKTFAARMEEAGLAELAMPKMAPRRKCQLLSQAGMERSQLVAESGQRLMLASIADSLPSYCSGIRCWAAYCDAMGHKTHFPATAQMVI